MWLVNVPQDDASTRQRQLPWEIHWRYATYAFWSAERKHELHSDSAGFTDCSYGGLYPGHIPTTAVQKALLAVGSGVAALQNPYRHGETCTSALLLFPLIIFIFLFLSLFCHLPHASGCEWFWRECLNCVGLVWLNCWHCMPAFTHLFLSFSCICHQEWSGKAKI